MRSREESPLLAMVAEKRPERGDAAVLAHETRSEEDVDRERGMCNSKMGSGPAITSPLGDDATRAAVLRLVATDAQQASPHMEKMAHGSKAAPSLPTRLPTQCSGAAGAPSRLAHSSPPLDATGAEVECSSNAAADEMTFGCGSIGRTTATANLLIKQLSQRESRVASDDADASRGVTSTASSVAGTIVVSEENSFPSCSHAGDDTSDDDEGEGTRSPSPTSASASAIDRGDPHPSSPPSISHVTTADTSGTLGVGPPSKLHPSDPLPADFDPELIFKMSNRETGEVFDMRTGKPWAERDSAAGGEGEQLEGATALAYDDLFRQRGLIPTREVLLSYARHQSQRGDTSGAPMASGEGGEEAADASLQIGAAGSDASTDKPKRNLLARAAHKVSKRTRAAAEKLKGGGAESSTVPNNKMTASGEARRHILPGHEQMGDHVKVSVHGKDYSEWSSLFLVQGLVAHDGPIWCLAWSLSGMFLASAGQDQVINVWKSIESQHELPTAWKPNRTRRRKSGRGDEYGNSQESATCEGARAPGFAARNSNRQWNCPVVCEDFTAEEEIIKLQRRRRREVRQRNNYERTGCTQDGEEEEEEEEEEEDGKEKDEVHLNGDGCRPYQSANLHGGFHKATPYRIWAGHSADIVDLSWNQNDFLLSASIDRTVRLWHVSASDCLHCFPHSDFVTSVDFHPCNDLLFLSGCFDKRLRIWSIPDSHVAAWATTPEMITSVRFSPNGAQALAGLFNGQVFFWHTDETQVGHTSDERVGSRDHNTMVSATPGNKRRSPAIPTIITQNVQLRYYTQVEARNRRGKFQHGRKVTGLCWLPPQGLRQKEMISQLARDAPTLTKIPASAPLDLGGTNNRLVENGKTNDATDIRSSSPSSGWSSKISTQSRPQQLLVTTNDSRMRLFQMETFSQLCKFKGQSNENLQIAGSFSSDGKYVVAGSDTGHVHIWNTTNVYAEALDAVGEHGVQVRGGQRWRSMASVAGASKGKHDRNTCRESFMATRATKGTTNTSTAISSDSAEGTPGDAALGKGGQQEDNGSGAGARPMPAIATAAVFAPFATVSLVAAASEVHMLYNDLEQLANSIIVVADYTGKLRFYMRASASEEESPAE